MTAVQSSIREPSRSAVRLSGISKRYGDLLANDDVNLEVDVGEIVGLLGENGAGKSTLVKVLYGLAASDGGQIEVAGNLVNIRRPKDAISAGIGMVTQHFSLVSTMSIIDNVLLGGGKVVLDRKSAAEKIGELSLRVGLPVDPHALVSTLSVGQRQRVEIIKALYRDCQLLVLDEPTAVLAPQEIAGLFVAIRALADEGIAVILITHKLNEIRQMCSKVTVLRRGKSVGTFAVADCTNEQLVELMVGRSVQGSTSRIPATASQAVLKVSGLSYRRKGPQNKTGADLVDSVSLDVRGGEILGVCGVSGNGQSELVKMLSGLLRPSAGKIEMLGVDLTGSEPAQFVAAGIGRIAEDRNNSVVAELSVAVNLVLERIDEYRKGISVDSERINQIAVELIAEFGIKAEPNDPVQSLSGGNMQKVLLARVLSQNPKAIVVAQPTRGLDVGATRDVRSMLIEKSEQGAAVLLVSEDLDELLEMCDRLVVMFEGKLIAEFSAKDFDRNKIGLAMTGQAVNSVSQ